MKLLNDELCRGSEEHDTAKIEAVKTAQNLARDGSLNDLISRASNLNKDLIMNAENVIFIDDPLQKYGSADSYYLGNPSIIFCGMTPICHQKSKPMQYDVLDRNAITEIGDYILFAGSNNVAVSDDVDSVKGNRLFIMRNTEDAKAHLYAYKTDAHAKNVEMWLAGNTNPADVDELAPMLEAAEEVRKKVIAANAETKAKLLAERAAAKLSA